MKKITMFTMKTCPHCKRALGWMEELYKENAAYKAIKVENIDENQYPDLAAKYDYYYVPTFYVGDEKKHEGAASLEIVRDVLDAAMKD